MTSQEFSQFLNELAKDSFPLLHPSILVSDYVSIDLSKDTLTLQNVEVSSSDQLAIHIDKHIKLNCGIVAYGGYLETRAIYSRSSYFNTSNPETERNIHLGLDLWIAADTTIYAPLEGKVHSFKNNTNFGDYGPTIILQHDIHGFRFYTLYGHLSLLSIESLQIGQQFKQGEQLATIGDASVNGDYPPHLHFQIIKDLQGSFGDYPGVCSIRDLEFYKENCPDPNLILKLESN